MKEAELIRLITIYSYPMIGVYYFFLDFISPLTDEVSLIAIAYLSKTGLMNKFGAALVSYTALYGRNYTLFLIARKKEVWLEKLTKRHPDAMERFRQRMQHKYFETILLLTFLPKVRILAPVIAGLGKESKTQFAIYEAICLGVFVAVYFSLGLFFYNKAQMILNNMNSEQTLIVLIIILILTGFLTFGIGRHFLKKSNNQINK